THIKRVYPCFILLKKSRANALLDCLANHHDNQQGTGMKRITWAFWAFLLGLTALWLMADTLWPAQPGYFALRTVWVQYSGVLVMGAMSLAMLLAVRPVWLERHLDGLDKMYRLH